MLVPNKWIKESLVNSYSSKVVQWTETTRSKLKTFPNKLGVPSVIEQIGHSGNWSKNYLFVVIIAVTHLKGVSSKFKCLK